MYSLTNEHLTIQVTAEGAMLTSIKSAQGIEYLWQADPEHWAGQAPVCFPICGGLRNGQATSQSGEQIRLGRHGFARHSHFELLDQDSDVLTFVLKDNPETLASYPFAFELEISYRLSGQWLEITYQVTNPGEEVLPYFIGGHPAFNCPLEEGLMFEDYQVRFDQPITPQVLRNVSGGLLTRKNPMKLDFDGERLGLEQELFQEGALVFENIESKKVRLESSRGQHGLEFIYEDFNHLLLWTSGTNAPFLALEPWNGLATLEEEGDVFEEKTGLRRLQSAESASYTYRIRCY